VRLRGVRKSYLEAGRERVVLRPFDLDVARGELVVVLGRSGSGKSTLLNLLAGIDLPSGGAIEVEGQPLQRLDETRRTRWRRRHVGFVFQAYNLVPTLTVLENVRLPLELVGQAGAAARARAEELLAEVGLGDRGASFPDVLSGGEQQRVAVARALAHRPLLVLADEPTGNLDLDTGLAVLDLLDRLTRREGGTLVMATHGREVVGIADRVLRIDAGVVHQEEA
jgi:putative ABC transport system ATP-binding protein